MVVTFQCFGHLKPCTDPKSPFMKLHIQNLTKFMDAFSTEITDTLSLGSIVSNMLSVHSLNYSSTEQDQNITPATMTNLDSFIRSMASMNEEICI
jgi:hypothetical protein